MNDEDRCAVCNHTRLCHRVQRNAGVTSHGYLVAVVGLCESGDPKPRLNVECCTSFAERSP